jgi:DNA-binding XRE family transcriptional regulator
MSELDLHFNKQSKLRIKLGANERFTKQKTIDHIESAIQIYCFEENIDYNLKRTKQIIERLLLGASPIADLAKRKRLSLSLSHSGLSKLIGIGASTLSNLESGKTSPSKKNEQRLTDFVSGKYDKGAENERE